jgi:dTMP kinase
MRQGVLIVFSGLDGAGKSTQIELLLERLRQNGQRPHYLWTRGGYTPLFERLKVLLRKLPGRVVPPSGYTPQRAQAFGKGWVRRLWLSAALLDLLWVYAVKVRWWRWRGQIVVCDRYLWDTLIDFRMNFPQEHIERSLLWRCLARLAPKPDAAFLLLVPVEESVRRSDVKGEPFRDTFEVLAQRLAHYQALADETGAWHVLDGQRPIDELTAEIAAVLSRTDVTMSQIIPGQPGLPACECVDGC